MTGMTYLEQLRPLVQHEFGWLLGHGYKVAAEADWAGGGAHLILSDGRHWLRVAYETVDGVVVLYWGEVRGPGTFNDDPYRDPLPISRLIPTTAVGEVEAAGSDSGGLDLAVARLSALVQEQGSQLISD